MKLPTADELQMFIHDLDVASNNYTHMAVHYIGNNDELYERFRTDSQRMAKISGWLMYMKKCIEEQS